MPVFSIIVPVYNGEKYLRKALDSVMKQSFKDWEMILIDDGSKDNSLEICREYEKKDSRIHCLHKDNEGVTIARKLGVDKASGDYIVFLDCDDWLDLDCLEKLSEEIWVKNLDILLFGHIDEMPEVYSRPWAWDREGLYEKEKIKQEIFPYLIHDSQAHYFPYNLCGNAIRRDLLSDNMIADSRATIGEDGACMIPAVYRAQTMLFMKPCFYHYLYNPASASRSHKVIPWDNARLIAEHIASRINLDESDFREQWKRKLVHDIFLVCVSRFNAGKSYGETAREIRRELAKEPYASAIAEARFSNAPKAQLMQLALKHRLVSLMKLYAGRNA